MKTTIVTCALAAGLLIGAQSAAGQPCVAPPNTTMVAWFPFDELPVPPLGTAENLAGADGVHIGGVTAILGFVGNALNFDGLTGFVETPSKTTINFGPATNCGPSTFSGLYSSCSGDFSIDLWIRLDGPVADTMVIVDKRVGNPPTIHGYSLALFPFPVGSFGSGNNCSAVRPCLLLQLADGLGSGFTNYLHNNVSNAQQPLTNGAWHHIAVTVDRTSPTGIRWYHDGVPLSQGSASATSSNPTNRPGTLVNNGPLRIGVRTAAPPNTGFFEGDMDELEIYNRRLTTPEVQSIFNASHFGKCKP